MRWIVNTAVKFDLAKIEIQYVFKFTMQDRIHVLMSSGSRKRSRTVRVRM